MYWKRWWCLYGEIFCRLKCGQRPRNTQNISCYCLMLGMFRTNKSWDPYANHIAVWHSANRTGLHNMQGVLHQKMTWKSRLVNCYVVHPGFTVTSLCINTHPFHSCIKFTYINLPRLGQWPSAKPTCQISTEETWAVCPSVLPSKQQKELKDLAVDSLRLDQNLWSFLL